MKTKIIIITSKFLYDFVKETLNKINSDCRFEVIAYENFHHITEIFKEYKDEADGFMTSGVTAMAAIEKAFPDNIKPIISFEADEISLYRMLLEYFVEKKNLDTKRVIFDFLLPIHSKATVEYFLHDISTPMIRTEIEKWLSNMTSFGLDSVEKEIANKTLDLWNKGEIDLVIAHYSSNIPFFEEHGIPYVYPYPSLEQMQNLVDSLTEKIEINRLRNSLPTVIALSSKDGSCSSVLEEAILNFKRDSALEFIVQNEYDTYFIFTNLKMARYLTDNMRFCHLYEDLKEKYNIETNIGYGVGNDISQAKSNSKLAIKESILSGGSMFIDENHSIIGPLNIDKPLEIKKFDSDMIHSIAEKCKLSSLTIQKLVSIVKMKDSNKITSVDLAERLGVTVRNANRILGNLEKGGVAEVVYTESVATKGRPVKVYELKF